jgi:hypothetical protein
VDRKVKVNIELKGEDTAEPVQKVVAEYLAKGWKPGDFLDRVKSCKRPRSGGMIGPEHMQALDHFPFSYRVALLLGLMLVVSLVDFCRNGARAAKFCEYGFIIITGAAGAAAGFVNDLITSSISPDYFILGKGLEEGPNLRMQAGLFGLQVGCSAGVIAGAVCLFACRRKSASPPAKVFKLLQMLWMPVAGAVLCGVALPLLLSRFDPAHFSAQLESVLDAGRISRFLQVWWTHVGLYAGMAAGLVVMILRANMEKKRRAAANQFP